MFKSDRLYFVPLGGAGEIGMNLNVYGCDDQWIIVDLGITFGNKLGMVAPVGNLSRVSRRKGEGIECRSKKSKVDPPGGITIVASIRSLGIKKVTLASSLVSGGDMLMSVTKVK